MMNDGKEMNVSVSIKEVEFGLSNEKSRRKSMASHLRAAADRIEKGEGVINYTVSENAWGKGKQKMSENTYLHWESPELVKKRKYDGPVAISR